MRKLLAVLLILLISSTAYGQAGYQPKARNIITDTTNFDVNLSTADTNVQKALDTLDELVGGGGGGSSSLSIEENDVQISSPTASIDFRDGLDVSESPTGEANVVVDPDEVISTGTYISWSGHTLNVNLSTGVVTQKYDTDLDDLADGTLSKSKVQDSGNWDSAYTHSVTTYNVHGLTYTKEGTGGGLDADTVDGSDASAFASASHNHNTSDITAGTLSTDRFSAYSDLEAESKIGSGSTQVAYGTHTHTGVYEPAASAIMKEGENVSLLTNDAGYLTSLATGTITQAYDADLDDLADGTLSASKVAGVKDADYGDVTVSAGTWGVEDKFLRNYEDDSSSYKLTVSSFSVTNQTTLNSSLSGLAKLTSGVVSAITDSSSNWNTAYTHSQNNTQAHSDYLLNNEDDITNYKITMSTLVVTGTATVGSLSSSGQVTSNSRKLVDQYDFAICVSTPNALSTIATLISPFRSYDITITTITAQIIGGTNVVLMCEQRTSAGIESAGTDIWTGDITTVPNIWTGGTTSDFTIPADSALVLVITSVSDNVDRLMIKGTYTKD